MHNRSGILPGIAGAVALMVATTLTISRATFERRIANEIAMVLAASAGKPEVVREGDLVLRHA